MSSFFVHRSTPAHRVTFIEFARRLSVIIPFIESLRRVQSSPAVALLRRRYAAAAPPLRETRPDNRSPSIYVHRIHSSVRSSGPSVVQAIEDRSSQSRNPFQTDSKPFQYVREEVVGVIKNSTARNLEIAFQPTSSSHNTVIILNGKEPRNSVSANESHLSAIAFKGKEPRNRVSAENLALLTFIVTPLAHVPRV